MPAPTDGLPLDKLAIETGQHCLWTIVRAGYSKSALAAAIQGWLADVPPSVRPQGTGGRIDSDDIAHVFTLWNRDPDYLFANGLPRPIPLRGPAPSIEALYARVRPQVTFEEAHDSFLRTNALDRVGDLYVPNRDALIYFGDPQLASAHALRMLHLAALNSEHNANPDRQGQPWYERIADSPHFPVADVDVFMGGSIKRAMEFLKGEDTVMERHANNAEPGMPVGRVSVSLFYAFQRRNEEAALQPAPSPSEADPGGETLRAKG
jgi:hypothetical protein